MSNYSQLNLDERFLLSKYHQQGLFQSEISKLLNRSPSTISRELSRNSNQSGYVSTTAQNRALSRCSKISRIGTTPALEEFIIEKLHENWTPEQISGRLKNFPEEGITYINHESIYQWIYKPSQKKRGIHKLLPQSHGRRGRRSRHSRSNIPNRISIHERPESIENREEIGHWEADLMSCKRGTQHLLVMLERKTRYKIVVRLQSKKAAHTIEIIKGIMDRLPEALKKSITFDNGGEFTNHQELVEKMGIKTYFCDPYASWQKGSVENSNGRLRRDFPRKLNLDAVSEEEIEQINIMHNLTPREILGYKTPFEAILQNLGENLMVIFRNGIALHG